LLVQRYYYILNMKRILISNTPIINKKVPGSWTTRYYKFINRNPHFFDYILSPDKSSTKILTTHKRKFITYRFFRTKQLYFWVGKDYIKNLNSIIKPDTEETYQIIIIDDFSLVKSIILWKNKLQFSNISIIYSFHGHLLNADSTFFPYIDKILFLTYLGYKDTINYHFSFPSEVKIIGNGVDSKIFFPLSPQQKMVKREELGFPKNKKIITWLANDRPSKGLNLFLNIINQLNKVYADLHFLIIGSKRKINLPNTTSIGKIPNNKVAQYLQISDYYFHTALVKEGFGLTIAEALKTGNIILASNLGGIPEVINCCHKRAFLIDTPNIIESWLEKFNKIYSNEFPMLSIYEASNIWPYFDWENRLKNALE